MPRSSTKKYCGGKTTAPNSRPFGNKAHCTSTGQIRRFGLIRTVPVGEHKDHTELKVKVKDLRDAATILKNDVSNLKEMLERSEEQRQMEIRTNAKVRTEVDTLHLVNGNISTKLLKATNQLRKAKKDLSIIQQRAVEEIHEMHEDLVDSSDLAFHLGEQVDMVLDSGREFEIADSLPKGVRKVAKAAAKRAAAAEKKIGVDDNAKVNGVSASLVAKGNKKALKDRIREVEDDYLGLYRDFLDDYDRYVIKNLKKENKIPTLFHLQSLAGHALFPTKRLDYEWTDQISSCITAHLAKKLASSKRAAFVKKQAKHFKIHPDDNEAWISETLLHSN